VPIDQIKHSDIASIISAYPWKKIKTRNNSLSCIKRAFALAVLDDIITKNPAEGVTRPRNPKRLRGYAYTVKQAELIIGGFLHLFGPAWMNYITVGFFCGMRPSELIALLWSDIDFEKNRIAVTHVRILGKDHDGTKTGVERYVPLCPRARAALISQQKMTGKDESGAVFHYLEGRSDVFPAIPSVYPVVKMWHQVIAHVGLQKIGLTPKHMRSTSVTWLLTIATSPAEIPLIARTHGHSAATLIQHYAAIYEDAPTDGDKEEIRRAMGRESLALKAA
jgi:integrase